MRNQNNLYQKTTVFIAICLLVIPSLSNADKVTILVNADKTIGEINPLIFGNNIMSHDPSVLHGKSRKYVGHSNYGTGVWDPSSMRPVSEVVNMARHIGVTIMRFPGGSELHDWKITIGPPKNRPGFLFGLEEALRTCEEIGCKLDYIIPYFSGSAEDAADLVEYLNAPADGSNPRGGIDWANERAKNGHPVPHDVKLFELGNEVNYGMKRKGIPRVDPEVYARDYVTYRDMMKSVDPSIKLGAVTVNSSSAKGRSAWNDRLFKHAGSAIDFLIEHTYSPNLGSNDDISREKLYILMMESLDFFDKYYKQLSGHFQEVTGRTDVPIAVTEYNGRFEGAKTPFQLGLGSALFNAGLIQFFMKPENNIMMANYWQLINSAHGMIKNDGFMDLKKDYIKRPNYYVMEGFVNHFGSNLIDVSISNSGKNKTAGEAENLLSNVKWKVDKLRSIDSLVRDIDIDISNDIVSVSFNREADIQFSHVRKEIAIMPDRIYHLSGFMKAENLIDNEGVSLAILDSRGVAKTHSSASTARVWGTTDWVYVETDYLSLRDATGAKIAVRRNRGYGNTKGKVYVRDVKLTEKNSQVNKYPLSVSASRSDDHKRVYVLVLNRNVTSDTVATIRIEGAKVVKKINVWTLNGGDVWAMNELDPNQVALKRSSILSGKNNDTEFIFPAHSLTSLEYSAE